MATSTASGHHVVDLFDATACPAEVLACSFAIMGGNGNRLPQTVIRGESYVKPVTRASFADGCRSIQRMDGYFLSTVPFNITVLDGASGFMLSSAVMKTSKFLYVVAAFRLPSRSLFTRSAPSNSGSLPRGCTQTRYVCLAGVSDCGVAMCFTWISIPVLPLRSLSVMILPSAAGAAPVLVSRSSRPQE